MAYNIMKTVLWDGVEGIIIDREEQVRLSSLLRDVVINDLTPRESALFLSLYDGYTCTEISEKWDVTPRAVNKILSGLREKVKERLLESEFAKYLSLGDKE